MADKFTPGPWHRYNAHGSRLLSAWHIRQTNGPTIARVDGNGLSTETDSANARLIAAAPEMLSALRALTAAARTFRNVAPSKQQWTSLDEEALTAAFTAIAKATEGQS